jgi:hypothetical protein
MAVEPLTQRLVFDSLGPDLLHFPGGFLIISREYLISEIEF